MYVGPSFSSGDRAISSATKSGPRDRRRAGRCREASAQWCCRRPDCRLCRAVGRDRHPRDSARHWHSASYDASSASQRLLPRRGARVGHVLPVALLRRSRALAADARADLASPRRDVKRDLPDRVTAGNRTGGGAADDRRSASASFTEGPCQAPPRVQPPHHVEQTFSFGHERDCASGVSRGKHTPDLGIEAATE